MCSGLALSTISLAILLLVQQYDASGLPSWGSIKRSEPLATVDDSGTSPEGAIRGSLGMTQDYRGRPRELFMPGGMVAADHGRCSDIGMRVLVDGGNAVDAAVATALCQGVMNPMASGVGGGGFMVIRTAKGEAEVIDAREVAPAAATEGMFQGNKSAALEGGLAIAVPLELKGLWMAHQRYGRHAWGSLVAPAAALARNGFPAHPYLINALNDTSVRAKLLAVPAFRTVFFKEDWRGGWRVPAINETCCIRPVFANFLDAVGAQGPEALYTRHAEDLASEIRSAGGIITADDLKSAMPVVKDALSIQARGLRFFTAPPPSGAAAVLAAVQMIAAYQAPMAFAGYGDQGNLSKLVQAPLAFSGRSRTHRLVEVMKNAFAMRSNLGDPGICKPGDVPGSADSECFQDLSDLLTAMLSPAYADTLKSRIMDNGTLSYTEYGGEWTIAGAVEDHGTSHLSVVDAERNAVSFTTTINTSFGSKVVSESTGIILNNQMDDFSTPDQANTYGLPPSKPNFIRPFKKPQSSMSPLIVVTSDGRLRGVLGASGGPRIISALIQTLFRLIELGEDLFTAIAQPRVHDQVVPNSTLVENWSAGAVKFIVSEQEIEALKFRKHDVQPTSWSAIVQGILVDPSDNMLTAVSDPRKDGAPAGY
ncbi:g107 [Coccomyxa elongata]